MVNQRRALFLDRDGVINVDTGYLYRIGECRFIENIFDLCAWFNRQDYVLVVVTNQSGIGRGYYTEADFHQLMDWMHKQFNKHGLTLLDVLCCPHHPEKGLGQYRQDCECRKPKPGMLLEAAQKHNINLAESWMIGDSLRDIEAAQQAGVKRQILLTSDVKATSPWNQPTLRVNSLAQCLTVLEQQYK